MRDRVQIGTSERLCLPSRPGRVTGIGLKAAGGSGPVPEHSSGHSSRHSSGRSGAALEDLHPSGGSGAGLAALVALTLLVSFSTAGAQSSPVPNSDELGQAAVRLLQERCLACHNATQKTAGLDFSSRSGALKGGERGPALVPGDAEGSLLYQRVAAGEMPLGNPLPNDERDLLRRWIEAGATWHADPGKHGERPRAGPDWWSFQPLRRSALPDAEHTDLTWKEWRKSPIDRWVYHKLRQANLQPSPPADRRTLIRRATFDLLGLPPTPEEVAAFVNDPRPDAYERLIDRLRASPRYGERWARHWLDVVRFAESEGFERDWLRENAWPYRDYVIRSFNQDKSYQQFAAEHVAGDVLEPVTHDGIIATTSLVAGPYDAVGLTSAVGVQRAQAREDQLEEMLSVVGQTFLGLTVNCARCHDHKFDPIRQKEYYRLKAAFEGIWQGERDLLTPTEQERRNAAIQRLEKPMGTLTDRLQILQNGVRERILKKRGQAWPENLPRPIARWTFDQSARDVKGKLHLKLPERYEVSQRALISNGQPPANAEVSLASSAKLSRDVREKTIEAWVRVRDCLEKPALVMMIRNIEGYRGAASDGIRFAGGRNKQWSAASTASFRTKEVEGPREDAAPGDVIHLAVVYTADDMIQLFRNGKPYGHAYSPDAMTDAAKLQTYNAGDAEVVFGDSAVLAVEEARLYSTALTVEQIAASYRQGAPNVGLDELVTAMSEEERSRHENMSTRLASLEGERVLIREPAKVFAAIVKKPEPTYVLQRGDPSRKGELVSVGALASVSTLDPEFGLSPDASEAERRRRLAAWITHRDNPLFARAIVNRVWHYHFGRGFVNNPNDLGFNGGEPSHRELIDRLALDFIDSGWSLKSLHKRIMLSQTYQQSSGFNAKAAELDGDNRLLWRFTPKRLEGEVVRDAVLAVSGRLNLTMGGAGYRPFTDELIGALRHYHLIDSDDQALRRRTIYRMNVNSATDPLLDALDCPVPSVKTPRRVTTTTPLQALSLMNNPLVNREARAFAQRVTAEAGADVPAQIERAFLLALGRKPAPDEVVRSESLIADDGLEALGWGLFNTSEFLYVK